MKKKNLINLDCNGKIIISNNEVLHFGIVFGIVFVFIIYKYFIMEIQTKTYYGGNLFNNKSFVAFFALILIISISLGLRKILKYKNICSVEEILDIDEKKLRYVKVINFFNHVSIFKEFEIKKEDILTVEIIPYDERKLGFETKGYSLWILAMIIKKNLIRIVAVDRKYKICNIIPSNGDEIKNLRDKINEKLNMNLKKI